MHLFLGSGGLLSADKSSQPAQDEEYLALPFHLRQSIQGWLEVGVSQFRLIPVVESSQTLLNPVFGTGGIMQVILEVLLLGGALRARRLGHVSILVSVAGIVALLLGSIDGFAFGIVQSHQRFPQR